VEHDGLGSGRLERERPDARQGDARDRTDRYTVMEWNWTLYFGVAYLYNESTLFAANAGEVTTITHRSKHATVERCFRRPTMAICSARRARARRGTLPRRRPFPGCVLASPV
jgi:hypothetical protein